MGVGSAKPAPNLATVLVLLSSKYITDMVEIFELYFIVNELHFKLFVPCPLSQNQIV